MSKKPENKLYDSFSTRITNKENLADKELEKIKRNLKRSWSTPEESKETSSVDVEHIKDKFERDDIQEAYNEYLMDVEMFPIEATTIKFQNGFLAAEEQAYRIRHMSVPRSLTLGYADNVRWANGLMHILLIDRISDLQELAQADYEYKHEDSSEE